MRVSTHPGYVVELPAHHPFPMRKFTALAAIVRSEGLARSDQIVPPEEATWEDMALAHTERYLASLRSGLSREQERRLGLPWSPGLVRRSRLATQGTINAARWAQEDGLAGNLAGGTHHALADGGEGFCVINDVAVAVRVLRRESRLGRALLIDLDVHQGNANALAFAEDPETFTFSMHGARSFPLRKPPSDLDVPLEDGMDDERYLAELDRWLPVALERARPELAFYLAGVDVVEGDRYGRLRLTRRGLVAREERVLATLRAAGVPICIVLSGGYAATPERTADLHAEVFRVAASTPTVAR